VGPRRYKLLAAATFPGQDAQTGPTLSGCSLTSSGKLELRFNQTLLGTEGLALRPFESNMSDWANRLDSSHKVLRKTDSMGLMACTATGTAPPDPNAPPMNATTCACQSWAVFSDNRTKQTVQYCEVGPGWQPTPEAFPLINRLPVHDFVSPFQVQWTAIPVEPSNGGSLAVDGNLAILGGQEVLAIRLAWPIFSLKVGRADDGCCPTQATYIGVEPCIPGNCPLYSSVSELPANPFFAVVSGGHCACSSPQSCSDGR
jgi:hypothetical protein